MKPIIQKIRLLIAVLLGSLSAYAYDFEVDGIYYNVISLEDMTCEVVKGNKEYSGEVIIPADVTYNGRKFTIYAIGRNAFYYCDSLESVSIPNTVTSIGSGAFYFCYNLASVDIPNSVTSIGDGAFEDCSRFESMTIPNSISSIGNYVFRSCSLLKNLIIHNSVKSIGYDAFSFCTSLECVNIPNSVISIGHGAFYKCESLKEVILSESLEDIPYGLFEGCNKLESLEIPASVNKISQYRDAGNYGKMDYTFPGIENLGIPYSPVKLEVGYNNESKNSSLPGGFVENVYTEGYWNSWTSSIKNLYIDRPLAKNIWYVGSLENLELGESIEIVQVDINKSEKLSTIVSHVLIPPTLPEMSNAQYMNVNVYVPEEALEAYKADENWGKFWNLQASGVDGVKVDSKKEVIGRYDINGQTVSEDYQGLVIVRFSDGSCKKMLNL